MGTISFNDGWLFGPASAGSDLPGFDDSGFAEVALPHTVTPLPWQDWDPSAWERVWAYRKHFDAPRGSGGMRVFLDFGAAMTHAVVTLNGVQVADHLGGYLPFSTEIGGRLQPDGNVLAVRLDSTFNLNVPPDRPAPQPSASVDYWQPGGLYRDVRLRVVPPAFLADVFAKPVNVLDAAARQVVVQATVDAAAVPAGPAQVAVSLLDEGRPLASARVPTVITGPGQVPAGPRHCRGGAADRSEYDRTPATQEMMLANSARTFHEALSHSPMRSPERGQCPDESSPGVPRARRSRRCSSGAGR